MRSGARPGSPLVTAAVALAAAAAVLAAWLLQAHGHARHPGGPDTELGRAAPGPAGSPLGARVQERLSPPRLLDPAPGRPGSEQAADLGGLDRSSRAEAAAEVGLTVGQAATVAEIYRRADERRDALESRTSARPRRLRASSVRLRSSGLRTFRELASVLGEERARALESARAAAYAHLSAAAYGAGKPDSAAASIAEGRLFTQERVVAHRDGPFIDDTPAETAPP
jgi:hypothetical protein